MLDEIINKILIYPTDTVWGIGAPVNCDESNRYIKTIKKCDELKPMSIMIHHFEILKQQLLLDRDELIMFEQLFKNKITVLFLKDQIRSQSLIKFSTIITGSSEFIGCRVFPIRDIEKIYCHIPIMTSTSLNLSGQDPILTYVDACQFNKDHFNGKVQVLKSNDFCLNSPSTILKYQDKKLYVMRGGADFEKLNFEFKLFAT